MRTERNTTTQSTAYSRKAERALASAERATHPRIKAAYLTMANRMADMSIRCQTTPLFTYEAR